MAFLGQAGKFRVLPLLGSLAALLLPALPAPGVEAVDRAAVISDYHTGVALAGYDPVAYFAEKKPVRGRSDLEYVNERGTFRFRNEGNRDAFVAHPEIYAPQFSGYDPLALARGVALAGNPLEWSIVNGRLYLFYSQQAHAAFNEDPDRSIAAAAGRWPGVARRIIP